MFVFTTFKFLTISSSIWKPLSCSHVMGSFCKKSIGMENLAKNLFCALLDENSPCPFLQNFPHCLEKLWMNQSYPVYPPSFSWCHIQLYYQNPTGLSFLVPVSGTSGFTISVMPIGRGYQRGDRNVFLLNNLVSL